MPPLRSRWPAAVCAGASLVLASFAASADPWSWNKTPSWTPGTLVLPGAGCPIETPDGLSLMIASARTGTTGGLDIWALDRSEVGAAWSEPKHLPFPINTDAADFCPSPFARSLYFVSARSNPESCGGVNGGGGDIYLSRQSPAGDWSEPEHLACADDGGPNTTGVERSPSLVETWYGTFLFYSTNAGVEGAKEDIYVSIMGKDGRFGRGYVVSALSTVDYQDQMPTVRAADDGSFAVTFNSDRPDPKAAGGQDAYYATAAFLPFWWTKPQNAGPNVNTAGNETRASLSSDLKRFYVGRGDVYVSERR